MNKKLRVSIVIPVYNEEAHLGACLRAIAAQTNKAYEVIVVDNNSTDSTLAVAARFPFVKVLREPRQGVVYARNQGFNAARGEIIGRIDADTIVPVSWTRQIARIFEDVSVSAVSGAPHYYDFALNKVADAIDRSFRAYLANNLRDTNFLYGANMAVRRNAWHQVRNQLCHLAHLHEDFDLAIHLQEAGYAVNYDSSLIAGVSGRRIDTSFAAYARYILVSPKTYAYHGLKTRRYMYPVVAICCLCYMPGRVVYRGYDSESGGFSLAQLFSAAAPRVDPTSNIV